MTIKYIVAFILFTIFAILQNSFLPFFNIMGESLNLVFILFFVFIFFENKNRYDFGFFTAVVAGLFIDMFLQSYFGISIVCLITVYLLNKLLTYLLKDRKEGYSVFYFILIFIIGYILYNALMLLFSLIFRFHFDVSFLTLLGVLYNAPFAVIGFYIYKNFFNQDNAQPQLKLFK